jgi:hypothetical protein
MVEGLSVVVLSYCAIGLLGYVAKAAKAAGFPVEVELGMGLAVPVVVGAVWLTSQLLRRRLHRGADAASPWSLLELLVLIQNLGQAGQVGDGDRRRDLPWIEHGLR